MDRALARQIELRRPPRDGAVNRRKIRAGIEVGELRTRWAQQRHHIAIDLEGARRRRASLDQADHPDHWRRIDGCAEALVVQADIARDHRRLQRASGVGHPGDGLG